MCSSFQRIIIFIFFYRSFINCVSISKRELKSPGKVLGEVFEYEWEPPFNQYVEDRSNIVKVPLQDIRTMEYKPTLDTHGFTWVSGRPSTEEPLWEDRFTRERAKGALQADSVELVKELTGANSVIALTDTYRDHWTAESKRIMPAIHSDVSPRGAKYFKEELRKRLLDSNNPNEVKFRDEWKKGKDVVIYTVWRPLRTVQDNHLGLCSWDSLLEGDAMKFGQAIKSIDISNAFEPWKYREGQRWHYLSDQTPDEAIVFHGSVPHASFYLKSDTSLARISYEATIMAIVDLTSKQSKLRKKINPLSLTWMDSI